MKRRNNIATFAAIATLALAWTGCTREIETEVLAEYPNISDVFIDGFASDLEFQAWGKSTNFFVDNDTKYSGTAAMRIEVPQPNDPMGSWAGGVFYSTMGRNLTNYDALTFYAKSSVPTHMETGFGNFGDDAEYQVTLKGVELNTNWRKIIIPIPNAAKLRSEKGLFYYSAGAVDNEGYAIWIDDVRFERLGMLAHPQIESIEKAGFPGNLNIGNLTETINLPNGVNQRMEVSSKYFTFESSDTEVASTNGNAITVHKTGEAIITFKEAEGQIRLHCHDFAPAPTRNESDVISLFSDAYTNTLSANWNPYWLYSTAEFEDIDTGKGHVAQYTRLNFVGIVFSSAADCSQMTHLHFDVLSMDEVTPTSNFTFAIHANGGASETSTTVSPTAYAGFEKGKWVSVDMPLSPLGNNKSVTEFVLSCTDDIQNLLLDNIYFYKN